MKTFLSNQLLKFNLLDRLLTPVKMSQTSNSCFETTNPHIKYVTPTSMGNTKSFLRFSNPTFEPLLKISQSPLMEAKGRYYEKVVIFWHFDINYQRKRLDKLL